jgi:hypothetical protein
MARDLCFLESTLPLTTATSFGWTNQDGW